MSVLTATVDVAPRTSSGKQRSMASVVFAGSIGTVIEWYDFLIYGTAAALVFNSLFFPNVDPLTGTLAALGAYAAGFFARPVGGILFGHFGDRIGRKTMLMITMAVMGLGTFCVGLLPTYHQIGIWAPILLITLRIVQGIGLGGEWGGASLVVLEHAPAARRGFYGSLVQVGFPLGMLTSTGAFALAATLPQASFVTWGWRVPFLLSIGLLGVGWFVRRRVAETPVFEDIKRRGDIALSPFLETILRNPRSFLVAIGLKISEVSWVYILTIFAVVYATTKLGVSKQLMLDAIIVAALVAVAAIPLFGWLSDIFGRRALYFAGTLFTMSFAFPLFWLLDSKNPDHHHPDDGGGAQPRSRHHVWVAVDLLSRAVRHARALHRRLARVPACGRHRRRADAAVRHVAGELHRRHRRRLADADPLGGDHLRRGVVRAGNKRPIAAPLMDKPLGSAHDDEADLQDVARKAAKKSQ